MLQRQAGVFPVSARMGLRPEQVGLRFMDLGSSTSSVLVLRWLSGVARARSVPVLAQERGIQYQYGSHLVPAWVWVQDADGRVHVVHCTNRIIRVYEFTCPRCPYKLVHVAVVAAGPMRTKR